ncbi:glutamate-5-semialdehyde dehydrogenase [Clostridium luticellarii]|jgi:glutamate-5-semialdehyde dehydrogenase|uniref:glutamate-5-semialdehyde dehydrogenase n=1 Tax=Clostridium luticellarii TaxID=1691940 RepID=UPI002357DC76|nr:glutamate-5-semialdehyde dehydrogenase [Clostridium luticellarii]MCI1944496.1 glutamate-5-semialdehyde dehydrogenase [Clostridium luticellarii]MCI1967995.1 glutamate-5-semialdehyde dehydrogenase [Clostridium luticellarii]MCI1995066.1 glutamate-5-semialdehyde dehydrogenase [Clostridium luticellarii]MCI2039225.1 glutamate-5-semialdehyde dehydrogenase [Clostridium luticellarii]
MNIDDYIVRKAEKASLAARILSNVGTEEKNKALLSMARQLKKSEDNILRANEVDLKNAKKSGKNSAFIDRLSLDEKRINSMSEGLEKVASLPDPIGEGIKTWKRPNGLSIEKIRVPLGTIGIIYEARPNVTVDASALCLKSGNSVILRGGKEAINSNSTIYNVINKAAVESGLPEGSMEFIDVTERDAVEVLMKLNEFVDVLIPRGGRGLIKSVVKNSTVPVIETGAGNCHVYVDAQADLDMAEKIVVNAKTQRPAVCNAMETLLVHKDIAEKFLPHLGNTLKKLNVEIRGCSKTQKLIPDIKLASEEDYETEFLDLVLAVKVVDSIDEAIDHIYKYGTKHSESIITDNYTSSQKFLKEVDAAAVYVNASTRFTDGGEFGFGAEIGISTQKLHARGPMGLNELTTTKYMIYGNGQTRK